MRKKFLGIKENINFNSNIDPTKKRGWYNLYTDASHSGLRAIVM